MPSDLIRSDQEARVVTPAHDVESHHVDEFVGNAVRLEIRK